MKLPLILLICLLLAGCAGFSDNVLSDEERINHLIEQMDDRRKIGQLVMAATLRVDDEAVTQDDPLIPLQRQLDHMQTMIRDYHIGSVIIYLQSGARDMTAFNSELQRLALENEPDIPLFISGDLEYGAAQRVPEEATNFPRQMGIGATGKAGYAETFGRITAVEARAMGYNWSFSPVADVNSNPVNPVIGVRAFGEDPAMVSEMTAAMIRGSQAEGVIATPKHFPGHGDTGFDSHYMLSKVSYGREVLDDVHLPPFRAAIGAGAASIMTAHVIVEALDPDLPATLSEKVLTGLLREEMGFDGIVVTDAMSMDAIRRHWGAGQAAVMAVNAGADIIMATGSAREQVETFDALYEAYQTGEISEERVEESLRRILGAKLEYGLFGADPVDPEAALAVVGKDSHREAADEIGLASITVVKNEGILPFDPGADQTTFVAGVMYTEEISAAAARESRGKVISREMESLDPGEHEIHETVQAAAEADRILIFTYSDSRLPEGQIALVKALKATGKPSVVISLGLPYDLQNFPEAGAYIASYALDNWYWITPVPTAWEAAVKVVFGAEPGGKFPVKGK